MRLAAALILLFATTAAQAAPPPEAAVLAFVARQQRAWNAADLSAYFATFAPEAVFIDQARSGDRITPYGRSTVREARVQTRRFFASSKVVETGQVLRVQPAADGSVRVVSSIASRITSKTGVRNTCAQRLQVLVTRGGGLATMQQTDTVIRCPRR